MSDQPKLTKLTRMQLQQEFFSARNDHPGRKGFELMGPSMRGWFYSNPEGCTGTRIKTRPVRDRRLTRAA